MGNIMYVCEDRLLNKEESIDLLLSAWKDNVDDDKVMISIDDIYKAISSDILDDILIVDISCSDVEKYIVSYVENIVKILSSSEESSINDDLLFSLLLNDVLNSLEFVIDNKSPVCEMFINNDMDVDLELKYCLLPVGNEDNIDNILLCITKS